MAAPRAAAACRRGCGQAACSSAPGATGVGCMPFGGVGGGRSAVPVPRPLPVTRRTKRSATTPPGPSFRSAARCQEGAGWLAPTPERTT